jgi:hypothetical protein
MQRATYRWKSLNEGYNFALDLVTIKGLHKKLCAFKVARVSVVGISQSWDKNPFGCGPRGEAHNIL